MSALVTLVPRPPAAPQPPPPSPRPPDPVARRLRWAGEIVVTLGVVVALFAGYEVWVTNLLTAGRQAEASQQLTRDWAAPGPEGPTATGDPAFRLFLPSLGGGFSRTVVEGTDSDDLAKGPGHYTGTANPGQVGDLAIAGHRTTHGAPFRRLGELRSCAPIVVETRAGWAVYRVLPMANEVADWASGRGTAPECAGLQPIDSAIPGRQYVPPSDVGVIAPVPNRAGVPAAVPLVTLTTCDPPFSARQRMVIHGVLDRVVPKTPGGGLPVELAAAGDL